MDFHADDCTFDLASIPDLQADLTDIFPDIQLFDCWSSNCDNNQLPGSKDDFWTSVSEHLLAESSLEKFRTKDDLFLHDFPGDVFSNLSGQQSSSLTSSELGSRNGGKEPKADTFELDLTLFNEDINLFAAAEIGCTDSLLKLENEDSDIFDSHYSSSEPSNEISERLDCGEKAEEFGEKAVDRSHSDDLYKCSKTGEHSDSIIMQLLRTPQTYKPTSIIMQLLRTSQPINNILGVYNDTNLTKTGNQLKPETSTQKNGRKRRPYKCRAKQKPFKNDKKDKKKQQAYSSGLRNAPFPSPTMFSSYSQMFGSNGLQMGKIKVPPSKQATKMKQKRSLTDAESERFSKQVEHSSLLALLKQDIVIPVSQKNAQKLKEDQNVSNLSDVLGSDSPLRNLLVHGKLECSLKEKACSESSLAEGKHMKEHNYCIADEEKSDQCNSSVGNRDTEEDDCKQIQSSIKTMLKSEVKKEVVVKKKLTMEEYKKQRGIKSFLFDSSAKKASDNLKSVILEDCLTNDSCSSTVEHIIEDGYCDFLNKSPPDSGVETPTSVLENHLAASNMVFLLDENSQLSDNSSSSGIFSGSNSADSSCSSSPVREIVKIQGTTGVGLGTKVAVKKPLTFLKQPKEMTSDWKRVNEDVNRNAHMEVYRKVQSKYTSGTSRSFKRSFNLAELDASEVSQRCQQSRKKSKSAHDSSHNSSLSHCGSYNSFIPHENQKEINIAVTPGKERRILYVNKIENGLTKEAFKKRFSKFGPVEDVSLYFRKKGDNYGFVTYCNRESVFRAMKHGNDNPGLPKYTYGIGGRREFCGRKYTDLDSISGEKDWFEAGYCASAPVLGMFRTQSEEYSYEAMLKRFQYDSLCRK